MSRYLASYYLKVMVLGLTSKNDLLAMIGLSLIILAIVLLIVNPPRVNVYSRTLTIPYTIFKEIPPGPHNYTILYNVGKGSLATVMPGHKTIRVNVSKTEINNCTYSELVLNIHSEGAFKAVDGKYVNITLLVVDANKSIIEVDNISVRIEASRLAVTGRPYTVTSGLGETIEQTPIHTSPTHYRVESSKKLFYAIVYKPSEDVVKVVIDTGNKPIMLPLDTEMIILKVTSNAKGELRLESIPQYKCTITYYLDKPLYKPYTNYKTLTIEEHHFNPEGLTQSIVIALIGISLILVSCYLMLRGKH